MLQILTLSLFVSAGNFLIAAGSEVVSSLEFQKILLYAFKTRWLTSVPPRVTLKTPTFCPHSIFIYFLWFSEQTAIIALRIIN